MVRLRIKSATVRTVFYVFSLAALLIIVEILSIIYKLPYSLFLEGYSKWNLYCES